MFDSIAQDIKAQFRNGNMVTRLIILNVGVFALLYLIKIILILFSGGNHGAAFNNIIFYLAIHSDLIFDLKHPWVFFTHMFLHEGFFHLLFNMLLLYWFGRIVGDLIGDDKPLAIYILGGLSGALLYVVSGYAIDGVGSIAIGASAAVMGFAVAGAAISPDYTLNLILIGPVRLKYVVLVLLVIDLIGIANMSNTGGHIGHLGGALFGWVFVYYLRNGTDLSVPVNNIMDWFMRLFDTNASRSRQKKKHLRVEHVSKKIQRRKRGKGNHHSDSLSDQERIDMILDKIRKNGLESLSEEERAFLNKASKT
jgi:membrane associated rhomboid family serine protease